MKKNLGLLLAGLCVLLLSGLCAAQTSEVKEKPPMYTYVSNWVIPRAQWGEMEKQTQASQKLVEKAFADGTILGYGSDMTLIHTQDGPTHDSWWSATSLAGVLNVLDQIYKSGNPTNPAFASATKHWDNLFVSRYYNWHAGSWKDIYTRVASYKLKPNAPANAVETVSKNLFVPLLEKLLSEGAIHEYEIDEESIHTDSPNMFSVAVIAASADGLDKFAAAARETVKGNPLIIPAEMGLLENDSHRDELLHTNATYK
jgi:hypothetical protein